VATATQFQQYLPAYRSPAQISARFTEKPPKYTTGNGKELEFFLNWFDVDTVLGDKKRIRSAGSSVTSYGPSETVGGQKMGVPAFYRWISQKYALLFRFT
jgi:hypothetical protein